MTEVRTHLYEGMFLLSQQAVATDQAAAIEHVRDILNRAEAEIIILSRWDERKLAYEIKKQKRGLFVLAYFNARATQIANIDRDCNLSEQVLRSLIIRADYMGEEEMTLAKENAASASESRPRTSDDAAPAAEADTAVATAEVDGDDTSAGEESDNN